MASRLSDDDELEETHEINVTPFIDVILVLLIIFMVAAPLSTVDVPVDLPAIAVKPQQRPEKPIFITIKKDLSLAVGESDVSKAALASAVKAASEGRADDRLFVRADKTVPYEALIEVMNLLRTAGFLKIALVGLEGSSAAQPAPNPDIPARD